MAVRLLERVPIDRIEKQAVPVDLGRVLMVVIMAAVYAVAFAIRKVVLALSIAVAAIGLGLGWAIAAARTGWQDAALPAEERRRARAT